MPLDKSHLSRLLERGHWSARPELPPITNEEWAEVAGKLVFDPEIEELQGLRSELDDCFTRFFRSAFTQTLICSKTVRSELDRIAAACDLILLCGAEDHGDRRLLDLTNMGAAARILLRYTDNGAVGQVLSMRAKRDIEALREKCGHIRAAFGSGRPSKLPTRAFIEDLVEALDAWLLDSDYMKRPSNRRVLLLDTADERDSVYAEGSLLTPFVAYNLNLAARKACSTIANSQLSQAEKQQATAYFVGYTKAMPTTLAGHIRFAHRKLRARKKNPVKIAAD